uniref:Putative secreted metalloprotease n=1 Tax=Ixodes ricinus TaxID=34613 RepID=A0A090X9I6_IXORI
MKSWVLCMALGGIIVGASTISIVQNITLGVRFVCDTSFVKARKEKNHTTPLREYLSIFLNAVELYLRESQCPKVKLVLTGVKETTEEEESHFEKTHNEFRVTLDPTFTLGLFQNIIIEDHIGDGISPNGYSYFNEICSLGVGLVHDSGFMFDGVVYMAQQIAHMLGSLWDISEKCPERGKTLMATVSGPRGLSRMLKRGFASAIQQLCKQRRLLGERPLKPQCFFPIRSLPCDILRKEKTTVSTRKYSEKFFKCSVGIKKYVAKRD